MSVYAEGSLKAPSCRAGLRDSVPQGDRGRPASGLSRKKRKVLFAVLSNREIWKSTRKKYWVLEGEEKRKDKEKGRQQGHFNSRGLSCCSQPRGLQGTFGEARTRSSGCWNRVANRASVRWHTAGIGKDKFRIKIVQPKNSYESSKLPLYLEKGEEKKKKKEEEECIKLSDSPSAGLWGSDLHLNTELLGLRDA